MVARNGGNDMVAEKLYRIPQSDLATIRIKCSKCGNIAELSVQQAASKYMGGECTFCKHAFFDHVAEPSQNPFDALHSAWERFKDMDSKATIEFVMQAVD